MKLPRLSKLLMEPRIRGLSGDDLFIHSVWAELIRTKPLLSAIYREWYRRIAASLPTMQGATVEIGSNGSFMDEYIPDLIHSDINRHFNTALQASAMQLPFAKASLKAIVMTNVLHHIEDPARFFAEAAHAVKPGGVIAMIDEWVNPWSRLIYQNLHHEPFLPDRAEWQPPTFDSGYANGATAWILFNRDRAVFESKFPEWEIQYMRPFMPFSYLVSGGASMKGLMPSTLYPLLRLLERPLDRTLGMFAHIVLVRR